jgi:hypothetical protein
MKALLSSPYFQIAILLNLSMYGAWSVPGWWDTPIAVLPNLLGFTLGGYAIFVSFGDDKFRSMLAGRPKEQTKASPFMVVSTTFLHFIVVQALALTLALVASSRPISSAVPDQVVIELHSHDYIKYIRFYSGMAFWFMGHLFFMYSVLLIISASLAIFRLTTWFDKAKTREWQRKQTEDQSD